MLMSRRIPPVLAIHFGRSQQDAPYWTGSHGSILGPYWVFAGLDALPPSPVKILKLHGSTNWMGLLFGGRKGFAQVSSALGLRPSLFCRPDFDYLGYSN
jgi:hypothetical protein